MKQRKPPKPKKCQNPSCCELFVPERIGQKVCGPRCAWALVNDQKAKEFNAETRRRKKAMLDKDPKHWRKRAKTACHAYIRERDKHLPCISCGSTSTAQWDAGHYRPSGGNSALRYHELNIHKQCCSCNDGNKRSGNITEYRIGLVKKIGVAAVEWLEGPHPVKRWTVDELKAIEAHYKRELALLKSGKV